MPTTATRAGSTRIYCFHQPNGQCRLPDPWGDRFVFGFRGGLHAYLDSVEEQRRLRNKECADLATATTALRCARERAAERPGVFRLWDHAWNVEAVWRVANQRQHKHEHNAGVVVAISVRGAHGMCPVLLKRSAPLAHLKAAMQQMGYDMANTWMCRLGGAPLRNDDSLTIAECGLGANSCVHVMGRLPGGGEATIREQKYLFDDSVGHLDLGGNGLGSVEVKEVATFLVSHEGATVRRLTLSGNEITDGGKDMSGLTALCEILPTLKHPISLELANCGLGVAEVNELASAIQAGAALNSIALDGCLVTGTTFGTNYGEHQGLSLIHI